MVVNSWHLALLVISNVCGGMRSIYMKSWNSTRNNSGFSVITTRSLARDLRNIADLSSWDGTLTTYMYAYLRLTAIYM